MNDDAYIDIDQSPATAAQLWRVRRDIEDIRREYGVNAAKVSATYRHIDECFIACGVPLTEMTKIEASGIIDLIARERRSGEHRRIADELASAAT
jgi:hypothetical protein